MVEAAGYLLVVILLIAGNALFVAAEFALVAPNRANPSRCSPMIVVTSGSRSNARNVHR